MTRAIHDKPRITRPTVLDLQDEWASLTAELGVTSDPGEARLIRERIAEIEAEAARLIESESKP